MASADIRIVHVLPGRFRLKASPVRSNPALARQVQTKLRGVSGVHEVQANPLTGSVLLLVDLAKLLAPEALAPLADTWASSSRRLRPWIWPSGSSPGPARPLPARQVP
jgi:hypothetical protein